MSTTYEDLFAGAAELTEYPDVWVPVNPGDSITGELLRYDANHAGKWLAIIRPEGREDEQAVWMSNVALRSLFEERAPVPGEHIGIRYTGSKTSANGRSYRLFLLVVVERPGAEPSSGVVPWLQDETVATEPRRVEPF